jgi:hypothetical protein
VAPESIAAASGVERVSSRIKRARGPCPKCGTVARTFLLECGGEIRPEGELVARTPPVSIISRDTIPVSMSEATAVHGKGAATEAIRIAAGTQSAASDSSEDGTVTFTLQGRSSQNEEGGERVARILVATMKQLGATWSTPVGSDDPSADYEAQGDAGRLKIQVTRAPSDEAWRRELGRSGSTARSHTTPDETADELRSAINGKVMSLAPSSRRDLTLAIDATQTLAFVLAQVVQAFRTHHGAWARTLGFESIWVVGPTEDLTFSLTGG